MAKVKSNKSYPTGTAYVGKKVGESEALGKIFVLLEDPASVLPKRVEAYNNFTHAPLTGAADPALNLTKPVSPVVGKKYNCVIDGAIVVLTYLWDYNNPTEDGLLIAPDGRLYVLQGDGASGQRLNTAPAGTTGLTADWSVVIP